MSIKQTIRRVTWRNEEVDVAGVGRVRWRPQVSGRWGKLDEGSQMAGSGQARLG